MALENHVIDVIFVTECLSLLHRIHSSTADRSTIRAVLSNTKIAAGVFNSVTFKHVHRHLNIASHLLARACTYSVSPCAFYSVLDFIRGTLCNIVE